MTFTNPTIKSLYFDRIIDCYNVGNEKEAELLILQLKTSDTSSLLLFLFDNFEYLENKDIVKFVIEIVF